MRLYLIRHGQSIDNFNLEYPGSYQVHDEFFCPELSNIGEAQARALAHFLAPPKARKDISPQPSKLPTELSWRGAQFQDVHGFQITHLYASPAIRAMATASIIALVLGIRPMVWKDLCEYQGVWSLDPNTEQLIGQPGPDRQYLAERFPDFEFQDDFGTGPWWGSQTEDLTQCRHRARRLLGKILQCHDNSNDQVAVITHSHFYNILLLSLLQIGPDSRVWFAFNNAAITRIDFSYTECSIMYQNRVDFLSKDLIT